MPDIPIMPIGGADLNGRSVDLTYWPVGIGDRSYSDHLDVAESGNFQRLAIAPNRAKALLRSGVTASDIVEQALEKGVRLGPLDGVATWVTRWRNESGDPALREMLDAVFEIDLGEALDIAASLGIEAAVAVAYFDEGNVPQDEIVEGFARLCALAQGYGIRIDIEPIPFWGVPNLVAAADIVKAANCRNAGILIDTWHIQKGSKDFEADLALLEQIPGDWLKHVQLADADLASYADTLAGDVMFRKFPGEGELQITRMLALIAEKGEIESIGPEIVNAEHSRMSNGDIGRESGRSTRDAILAAQDYCLRSISAASGKV